MARRFIKHGKRSKPPRIRHTKRMTEKDEDGQELNNPHGMKKAHLYANKSLYGGDVGTDFSVLYRFLHSRKGRPWDQVYSEICAEADDRSFQGHHLRYWLDSQVEQKCIIDENGDVLDHRGMPVWREFYVHPETGLLEYVEARRPRRPETPKTVFEMDGKFYHKHKSIWYRVEMEEDGNCWPSDLHDVFVSEELGFAAYRWRVASQLREKYGKSPNGRAWYCVKKQSANSREIAKLKKKLAA
jgi:hypothetical protein